MTALCSGSVRGLKGALAATSGGSVVDDDAAVVFVGGFEGDFAVEDEGVVDVVGRDVDIVVDVVRGEAGGGEIEVEVKDIENDVRVEMRDEIGTEIEVEVKDVENDVRLEIGDEIGTEIEEGTPDEDRVVLVGGDIITATAGGDEIGMLMLEELAAIGITPAPAGTGMAVPPVGNGNRSEAKGFVGGFMAPMSGMTIINAELAHEQLQSHSPLEPIVPMTNPMAAAGVVAAGDGGALGALLGGPATGITALFGGGAPITALFGGPSTGMTALLGGGAGGGTGSFIADG